MQKIVLFFCGLIACMYVQAQSSDIATSPAPASVFTKSIKSNKYDKVAIIPQPAIISVGKLVYTLPKVISINAPSDKDTRISVELLENKLLNIVGCQINRSTRATATIRLRLNTTANKLLGEEGYRLSVNAKGIEITANKPAGIFYGVQTLLQLLPPAIESKEKQNNIAWEIPYVEITDYPKLGWRGLMLDVSRHFFTIEEVKKYIDQMAKYKLNLLHLHLTDDEGWRIEIKKYPKLTSVGAWRTPMVGNFGEFPEPAADAPKNYGGFYTQEELKDLVKYAKERHIDILPEIDVPGHSMAILAAYPELAVKTNDSTTYAVRVGEKFIDWHTHTLLKNNTLNPADEKVYAFLGDVIKEIAAIFPFKYIHMGGDEAFYTFWDKSEEVKQLMKKENLSSSKEVQGYFERRVEKLVEDAGKHFIGWDEILATGVSKSAAIMAWQGAGEAGIKASKLGHKVVMTSTKHTYIDLMQGDAVTEAPVYSTLRLKKAYEFNPLPPEANAENILGGQANLWTEQVYNYRQAEYMTWPRGFALAECVWSPDSSKNWNDFVRRIEEQFRRLDYAKVKYSPAMYDPIVSVSRGKDGKPVITLTPEIEGLSIHYSFDNSTPDNYYPAYTKPLTFPMAATKLNVMTYKKGEEKPVGRLMSLTLEDMQKRMPKK